MNINTYTVTFNTDRGNEIAPVTVNYNELATVTTPTIEGYILLEWQLTDGTTFDLSNTPTSDITLKAVWALNGSLEDWEINGSTALYYIGDNTITELVIPPFVGGNKMEDIGNMGGLFYRIGGNNNITKIIISEGILETGLEAFSYATITSVTIPNSLTYIGSQTFSYCRNLNNITIPNSVTHIGIGAFRNSSLTNITMPDNITIKGSAFNDCNIERVNGKPHNGLFYSNGLNGDTLVSYGGKSTELDFIPNSVTSIGDYAFYKCSSLTSITIPDRVTSIGEKAFSYSGITSISAPSSLKGQEGNWGVSSDIITWRD